MQKALQCTIKKARIPKVVKAGTMREVWGPGGFNRTIVQIPYVLPIRG